MVGKTLGHYEILEPLGKGGMGEVYRARDTTLKRDVAVKVLSAEFVDDPDRLARLEREAHLLASLNHPNIATIHSLEHDGDIRFLVLELVKGESLERRLRAGPLTVEKAVDFAKQIAEALEAAHGEGIIHRDLKPANVVITPDGRAKVLDFGIAKAVATSATTVGAEATNLTVAGTLVGTVPFMSPEQIRGEAVDKRVDVWAFGCVMFEMLTGANPFGRETIADTLSAIIEQEADWGRLPDATPDSVRSLLYRCLQKDAKLRLRDLGDAWVEMNALTTDPSGLLTGPVLPAETLESPAPKPVWRAAVPWLAAGAVVGASLGGLAVWSFIRSTSAPEVSPIHHLEIGLPADRELGAVALSPDGLNVVYTDRSAGGRLFHRPMGEPEATPLEGTEGATSPFFSPDGEWVGFFAGRDIKKVALSGGLPFPVCSECVRTGSGAGGGTWLADETIVFANFAGMFRVPADGGTPTPFGPSVQDREFRYSRPSALPGGQGILVQVDSLDPGNDDGIAIALFLPESGQAQTLVEGVGANPLYSPTGHVVFARAGSLFAVPFDIQLLRATGLPELVLGDVGPNFSLSNDGTLVYAGPTSSYSENEVVFVDLEGNVTPLIVDPYQYWDVRLSPDGERLALSVQEVDKAQQIWVYLLDRKTMDPITFEGVSRYPAWSHDGARVAFSTNLADQGIQWKAPNSLSGGEEQLTAPTAGEGHRPGSFSPDGKILAFRTDGATTGKDIVLLSLEDDRIPTSFISEPRDQTTPRFSPDGRWMTYTSNHTGAWEVYLTSYPEYQQRRVSTDGGWHAVWARDGRSIYYRTEDHKMMAVTFESDSGELDDPEMLFEGRYDSSPNRARYDVAPGGAGFFMITVPRPVDARGQAQASSDSINVVVDWFEELKRLVPAGSGR